MDGLFDNLDLHSGSKKPKTYRVQDEEEVSNSDSDDQQLQQLSKPTFDLSKSILFNKRLTETQPGKKNKGSSDTENLNHDDGNERIQKKFKTIEDELTKEEREILDNLRYDDFEGGTEYKIGNSKRDKLLLKLYPYKKAPVDSDHEDNDELDMEFERYLNMLKYNKSSIIREHFWKANNPEAYEKRQLEKTGIFQNSHDKEGDSNDAMPDREDDSDNNEDHHSNDSDEEQKQQQSTQKIPSQTQTISFATLNDTQPVSSIQSVSVTQPVRAIPVIHPVQATLAVSSSVPQPTQHPQLDVSDSEDEIVAKKPARRIDNLFEDSDSSDDDEPKSLANTSNAGNNTTIDVSLIENYKHMTVQEKILARIKEKERLRGQKEKREISQKQQQQEDTSDNDNNDDDIRSSPKLTKKQQEAQQISEKVRVNERIKQGTHILRTDNPDKFNVSKFIDAFNEPDSSDDEDLQMFSNPNTAATPISSPLRLPKSATSKSTKYDVSNSKYNKLLKAKSDGLVTLDDDESDDDMEIIKLSTNKKTLFEMKEKLARRTNLKKDNKNAISKVKHLKNILRKEKEKQMNQLKSNRKDIRPEDAELGEQHDEMIEKLIRQEVARAEKIKKAEDAKRRREKKILKGQLIQNDEPEFSDEYSDEIEDDNSQEEEEENSPSDEDEKGEEIVKPTEYSPPMSALKLTGTSESLSQFFGSTLPDDSKFQGLNGLEIAKKLKEDQDDNDMMNNDFDDNTGLVLNDNAGVSLNDEDMDDSELTRSITTVIPAPSTQEIGLPSFTQKIPDTQNDEHDAFDDSQSVMMKKKLLDSQNFLPDTQPDEAFNSRQASFSNGSDNYQSTQVDPSAPAVISQSIGKLNLVKGDDDQENEADSEEEEEEEEDNDEETKLQRAAKIKELRRLEERRRRKKEREIKSKGLNKIMENEAEESEDEYQGLGGKDGEYSDMENSEDEKMLDDGTLIDVDENEMRARMAREGIDLDNALVKKIYGDLKSGAFRKRRGKDGAYSLDLEEDQTERIVNYYKEMRRKQEEAKKRENLNYEVLAKDDKTKAFSATMLDRKVTTDSFQFEEKVESEHEDDSNDDDDPFIEKSVKPTSATDVKPTKPKKRKMLTEEQIRKTISFIDDDYTYDAQEIEIVEFSDDGIEEIQAMKQNSIVTSLASPNHYKKKRKLLVKQQARKERKLMAAASGVSSKIPVPKAKRSSTVVLSSDSENETPQQQQQEEDKDAGVTLTSITNHNGNKSLEMDDDDGIGLLSRRTTSITDSFKLNNKQIFSASGKQLRNIQVTTSAKPVSRGKGSVTYLTNEKKLGGTGGKSNAKSGKLSKIEEGLKAARKKSNLKSLYNSGFN